jgi:hypothetical protein
MADLTSITAVRPTANTQTRLVQYGATIAAGQPLYLASTGKYLLADANASSTAAAASVIAMTPGVDAGYGIVAVAGSIILVGTIMVVGTTYIASDTAGGIMPASDRSTGDYVTNLGTASTATQLDLSIVATGIATP